MPAASVLALLRERASLQPTDIAYIYTDYDTDPMGSVETLTWSQIYRRTLNVALDLSRHGDTGERALIVAPQGLHYIAAFLGALQAGLIAVPLSVPQIGAHDERISAVIADTAPTVIATTSAITPHISEYVTNDQQPTATIVEIDTLNLDERQATPPRVEASTRSGSATYLQYTSGSTRAPTGVIVTDHNLTTNFHQLMTDYFADFGGVAPPDTTIVSWLPFYHDMGLILGIIAPILGGYTASIMSPMAFLARPARWIKEIAAHPHTFSAGPNFAFELAARKTTDADMAGLDLSSVLNIVSGSERVHPATLDRFAHRFAPYHLSKHSLTPSYGMAEATVYVATNTSDDAPTIVHFDSDKLADGIAQRSQTTSGTPLLSYGTPRSPDVCIVDPDTRTLRPQGTIGEIWVRGDNVAAGYWNNPEQTQHTFGGMISAPPPDICPGPWLRTGDVGFFSETELFIVGRIKDMLIVYGRNHYAEDIEATIQEITGGRVAAISVPTNHTEKLVTIIEHKHRGSSDAENHDRLTTIKHSVAAAISRAHGLTIADIVLVAPGAIPTTTSGKIRRSACVHTYQHQHFSRLDND